MKTETDNSLTLADPSLGLELRSAITWFATDHTVAKRYQTLLLRSIIRRNTPGSLTDSEQSEMRSWCRVLCSALVERLMTGDVTARGRLAGTLHLQPIPAEWWRGATLDLNVNTAEAGGTVLHALAISEAVLLANSQDTPNPRVLNPASDYMLANLTAAPVTPRRTGCAGRPSSANLAKVEMQRRADAGQMLSTLIKEAEHLVAWLQAAHPEEPQPKAKSLSDALRDEYRILKSRKS